MKNRNENNSKKEFYIPEQLDDNDFEKEKKEEKQAKKEKRFEINSKKIMKLTSVILVLVLISIGVYLYLNPIEKKATAPEKAAKDFSAYFNAGNLDKISDFIDLKGYFILGYALEEADYTKFDTVYKDIEDDETYIKYEEGLSVLSTIDDDILNSIFEDRIRIRSIESCNKIQNTDTLYKLRINYDYIYSDGQSETNLGVIYVSNASGKYRLVYGDWMEIVLNYYQTAYMLQSNYAK